MLSLARRGDSEVPRLRSVARLAAVLLAGLLPPACASAPAALPSTTGGGDRPAAFQVGRDSFAFANLVRAESPDRAVPFANYCIVMARGATQFFRFARFAPDETLVSDEEYTALTRRILAVPLWQARSDEQRIAVPAYASLHAFSLEREAAIKAAFGSTWPDMLHWRTWRVALPLPPGHDTRLARQLIAEADAGRPAPVMITNFPAADVLNHVVLVYGYRRAPRVIEFLAYDPNDPGSPLSLYADPDGFWVAPLPYSPPGRVRAFRLFASPLL